MLIIIRRIILHRTRTVEYVFNKHKTVVTCKIKHLPKCFRAVDFPRPCRGRKNVVKCFILHVTTSYFQHVFNILKHLQKRFSVLFYT